MPSYWTLHVKDFAKIREAKVEAAPLTFFVGDNNSGKSYLLSLLWGLTGGIDVTGHPLPKDQRFKIEQSQIIYNSLLEKERSVFFQLSEDEHGTLVNDYNVLLDYWKDDIVNTILNTNSLKIGNLRIHIPYVQCNVKFEGEESSLSCVLSHEKSLVPSKVNGDVSGFLTCYAQKLMGTNSSFVPAPRTGFLLTYRTLVKKALHVTFGNVADQAMANDRLTIPQISYLTSLANPRQYSYTPDEYRSEIRDIIHILQEEIIDGELSIDKSSNLPEYRYKQNDMDQALPLYLASGVVTEVSGLLSLLKFGQSGWILVYEEPEMCLHPELQWKMARVLVKLANAGISVWASTHSEIIIQHVNNMIKLANQPNREELQKELHYDDDDMISSDKVRMYQFDVDPTDHKTDVRALECGLNGFRIPTFGKVLREMRDEVWTLRIEKEVSSS